MADPLSSRPVPLEQTREAVIRQLAMQFAADNLDADQLEARIDRVHRAATLADLRAVVADLPVLADAEPETGTGVARATAEHVSDRQTVVAIMSGAERKGVWTPPRSLTVIAVMGGADLDFREACFGPGVTEVHVLALMGGVDITVPPGVQVECNGFALMGGFAHRGTARGPVDAEMPVLRIGGMALMGGVDVNVRYPGERASEARRRERLEKRESRRRLRGG